MVHCLPTGRTLSLVELKVSGIEFHSGELRGAGDSHAMDGKEATPLAPHPAGSVCGPRFVHGATLLWTLCDNSTKGKNEVGTGELVEGTWHGIASVVLDFHLRQRAGVGF